jgi:hypothetical protein
MHWPQVALRHSALPDAAKTIRALAGAPKGVATPS